LEIYFSSVSHLFIYYSLSLIHYLLISAIKPDEKNLIRSRLFERIDEPVQTLATQHAVVVSKIARIDFPNDW
jgi:hypothetical protein